MPAETKNDVWACRQLFFLLLKSEIWMDTKVKNTQVLKYAQLQLYLLHFSEKVKNKNKNKKPDLKN